MRSLALAAALLILLTACAVPAPEPAAGPAASRSGSGSTQPGAATRIRPEEIIQIIPRDAIPSIDKPQFLSADEASKQYADDEQVMAVDLDGDRRVYPVRLLATREIVNDVVGGVPVAVTF